MGSSELALTARSVLALALLAAAGESGVARAAPATCTADEVTLFSCPSRGKVVSICAIKGWSAASGYVEYRYGRKGDAEIVVPARTAASAPGKSVKVARLPLSGGGVAYAAFPAGRYDYAVYSAITRQGPKSGVAIDKDGSRVGARRCDRGKEGEFAPGFLDAAGLPPADPTFVLPD